MRARVAIYSKDGATFLGYMPVKGLKFSEDIGGGGSCTFDVLYSDYDGIEAWDSVIKIQLERAPGVWVNGPAYVSRHQYSHRAGSRWFSIQCRGLLEAWASETVLLPEYVVNTMTKRAREERGIGWMSTSYDAANDPYETWGAIMHDGRSSRPEDWPSGSGAEWITAQGSSQASECKYFRHKLTITGTASRFVRFWLSSDESATLWVAGERVIETSSTEDGYKTCEKQSMRMFPGTYVVGIRTDTVYSKGGSGTDPVIACGAIINEDGDPSTWIMRTDNATWIACRRDDVPPNDVPPGPNPGVVIRGLVNEAKERKASGWPKVTFGFTTLKDSYNVSWGRNDVTEQLHRYGQTTYWDLFQQWGESGEVDVWMGADYVLHASLTQGRHRALTFTETHFSTFNTAGTEGNGNWVVGQGHGGWINAGSKVPRREYALEVGTAYSRPALTKIAKASLKDAWRWDASGRMNPPQAGWIPYYDFGLGDDMAVHYQGVIHNLSVTSLSAEAGEGGLLWDVEFTEYPPEGEPPPVGGIPLLAWALDDEPAPEPPPPPPSTDPGLFYDVENYVPAPPTTEA
jgi:hypothetical protein